MRGARFESARGLLQPSEFVGRSQNHASHRGNVRVAARVINSPVLLQLRACVRPGRNVFVSRKRGARILRHNESMNAETQSVSRTRAGWPELEEVGEFFDLQATIAAIKAAWAKPVEGVIETGGLLCARKEAVGHGGWGKLFAPGGALTDQFNQDTAGKLKAIASDRRIANSADLRNLPRAYTVLYSLTCLPDNQWERALAEGVVRPDLTENELQSFTKEPRRSGKLAALLRAAELVRGAADLRGTSGMEQARYFVLKDDRLIAYNDRISISAPLGVSTGVELMVRADDLLRVFTDIPDEFVELSMLDDDGYLSITSATTDAGLATLPLEGQLLDLIKSMKLDGLKNAGWQDLPTGFINGIKLCAFSASKDTANVARHYINIDCPGKGKKGVAYSTDNWRISRCTFKDGGKFKFLIPRDAALELIKHEVTLAQQSGEWVHFRDDTGLIFSMRTIDVDFPDVDKFFGVRGETIQLPIGLGDAIRAVVLFAPDTDDAQREANMYMQKVKVIVHAQNDRGWIKRTISVSGLQASRAKIIINPIFFIDILRHATTMTMGENDALLVSGPFPHVMKLPRE